MHKKSLRVAALGVGLAFAAGSSFAAELSNGFGTTCVGTGSWHFVNPQTDGAVDAGQITAEFSCATVTALADKINRNNQHFNIATAGDCTLIGAITDLPGRLVLSDYQCVKKEPPPPPK